MDTPPLHRHRERHGRSLTTGGVGPARTASRQETATSAAQSRDTDQRHRDADPARPEDVNEVAASIITEQESGTITRRIHPHNGYYAGDFSTPRAARAARRTAAADSLNVPFALLHPGPVSGWHD